MPFIARFLLIFALMAPVATDARASEYERMLATQFAEVAFRAEIGGEHRRNRLIRWTTPIVAQMYDGEEFRDDVAAMLADLSRVTGHPIRLARRYDDPRINFLIWISPDSVYRQLVSRSVRDPCFTEVDSDPRSGAITFARVKIRGDQRFMRNHCIAEELTQAMGLMNDTNIFPNSVFNDASRITRLPYHDRLMLAVLYDPALEPNMPIEQAMRIAPALLSDLHARALARRAARTNAAQPGGRGRTSSTTSSAPSAR